MYPESGAEATLGEEGMLYSSGHEICTSPHQAHRGDSPPVEQAHIHISLKAAESRGWVLLVGRGGGNLLPKLKELGGSWV